MLTKNNIMKKFFLLPLFMLSALFTNAQNQPVQNNNKGQVVKVGIEVENLNLALTTYIETNYKEYKIEKAMSFQTDGVATKYKITIKKNDELRVVFFDKDYKFLNEVDPKNNKKAESPSDKNK